MKKFPRTLCSALVGLCTAASLTLSPLAAVIGTDLHVYDTTVHQGAVLSHGVYWGASANDKRTENYVIYTPNNTVKPILTYGDKVVSTSTVSAAAKRLESQGYRVAAGINGDFYYTGNGIPMGLLVTDGIIRSGYNYTWAIGFMEDGTTIMGDPKLSVKMNYTRTVPATETSEGGEETVSRSIYTVNKARDNAGIFLYTNDFNTKGTTGNTEAGVDVVLVPAEGGSADLRIGASLTMTVESVTEKTGATEVPVGKIVLSVNKKASEDAIKTLTDLQPGMTVTITTAAANGQWAAAKYITSGYKKLIENGETVSGLGSGAAPRTAVGLRADGSVVFYTIDGRRSGHSVGASEALTAQRLQQLGCTTAVCLDGGGSTTITATLPDSGAAAVLNQPSENRERAVSTHIFLVSSNQPSGVLDHYYVSPVSTQVLSGATLQLKSTAVDSNYIPMTDTAGAWWSTDLGSISETGLFTAGAESGTATVTFSNGEQSGSAVVETVATPDSIVARSNNNVISAIHTSPGTVWPLVISAVSNHMTLVSQNRCFTFAVTGNVGTITDDGVFTAGEDGAGAITITAGNRTLTIPVTVQSMPFPDVPLDAWYYGAVKYVYENSLMQGTNTGAFAPGTNTTRAMIVQILYNKEGAPASTVSTAFSDVEANQWYAPAVAWAASNAVVSGNGAGSFNPNGEITREQMAVILYNYAAFAGFDTSMRGSLTGFADAADVDPWAADAMSWAVGMGLLKGSNQKLNPLGTATRAEIAQVLQNFDVIFGLDGDDSDPSSGDDSSSPSPDGEAEDGDGAFDDGYTFTGDSDAQQPDGDSAS